VIDTQAPTFVFNPATVTVDLCSTSLAYRTEGISVQDANSSGNFQVLSDPVNLNVATTYLVSFRSTDLAGNVGVANRIVIVNPLVRGEGADQFSFGFGISQPAEFLIRFSTETENVSNVILCNDISFGSSPLSARAPLSGTFDGQGFELSNLSITSSSEPDFAGIFSSIKPSGLVRNLKIREVQIMDSSAQNDFGGVIAGVSEGRLSRVSVMESSVFSDVVAGGLVGQNAAHSLIERSSAAVLVRVSNSSNDTYAGGLAGANDGVIRNSYRAADSLQESIINSRYRGGITGRLGASGVIESSYSNAADVCNDPRFAGGILGVSSNGSVVDSYFNSDRSSGDCSDANESGVFALNDDEMLQASSFVGFDPLIWDLLDGSYPKLR